MPAISLRLCLQGAVEGAGGVVTITAECDRFLYNMMRIIAGTLVEVALLRAGVRVGVRASHQAPWSTWGGAGWNPGPIPSPGHHH